jgi:DNA-binding GntR family transcriptional regulator
MGGNGPIEELLPPRRPHTEVLGKIDKTTYRERVYHELKNSIVLGKLRPGQGITLKALSEQFGVSIIPIREALFKLESERIIVSHSNKSFYVNRLGPDEFSELMGIRRTLESQVVSKGCRERPAAAVDEVEPIYDRLTKAVQNPTKYITINRDFHFQLYSYAGLPNTIDIIENLWARVGPYIFIYTERTGRVRSLDFHRGMFEAFRDGDERKIVDSLRADLENSEKEILRYIETGDAASG